MTQDSPEIMQHALDQLNANSYLEPVGHQSMPVTSICLTIIFSVIFLLSTTLNTLFLIIFIRKPALKNISNRFIVSLTMSNLLSSLILLPIAVTDMFIKEWRVTSHTSTSFEGWFSLPGSSTVWCTVFNIIAEFSTAASVFCTVLIGFDRFFAITDPLHYHMVVTRYRSWLLIALGWILATFIGSMALFIDEDKSRWNICDIDEDPSQDFRYWVRFSYAFIKFVICFAIPFLMLSWAYSKIYSAAQQNSERARRSSLSNSNNLEVIDHVKTVSRSSSTRSTSSQLVSHIKRRLSNASLFLYKEEARAAKISIGVISLFVFCWFPFYLIKIIAAVFVKDHMPTYMYKIVLIFTLMNAVISPYVYMYRSKRIQKEVLRLFGFPVKCTRQEFERRKPIYHPLPVNFEHTPTTSPCLDIRFKIDPSSTTNLSDDSGIVGGEESTMEGKTNFLIDIYKRYHNKMSDISSNCSSSNSSNYLCPSVCYLPPSILKCNVSNSDLNCVTDNNQALTNLLSVDKNMPEKKV